MSTTAYVIRRSDPSVAAVRLWPAGRVVHVPGAGHCIHRDRWTQAMTLIRPLLEQHLDDADPG